MNETLGHAMTYLLEQGWCLMFMVRSDVKRMEVAENTGLKMWSYIGPQSSLEGALCDFAGMVSRRQREGA